MSNILEKVSLSVRERALSAHRSDSLVLNEALDEEVESHPFGYGLGEELELRRLAENRLYGFGRLQPLLDDESIEEIWVNGPNKVFVAKLGISEQIDLILGESEISGLVERMLRPTGRRIDRSSPFVDASLPDGSRLHVVVPDITSKYWSLNIRKFPTKLINLATLVSFGSITQGQAELLESVISGGANVLVSGATQSGKTTMLTALLDSLHDSERVITVEETFEIRVDKPDWVAMQTRQPNLEGLGEVTLRRLIKEALRMRPSRLVVGEVREAEALDLLIALNSGLPGMGTLHANSPKDAIIKLQTLPLLAGENISHKFIAPTVAAAIDLIIHVQMDPSGKRRISEIAALTGRYENDRPEIESLWKWNTDHYVRGLGSLPKPEKFAAIGQPLESWWNK